MSMEQMVAAGVLLGLLGVAVVSDLRNHRIPNLLILVGVALGLFSQAYQLGFEGAGNSLMGMLMGFAVFIPLYALKGMAAGDVKLMAMAGAFLAPNGALWAALFSLIWGGVCGFVLVAVHGQLAMTLSRYWLMLRARAYFTPASDEVAGKPFPYSVAILLGTSTYIVWPMLER